MWKFKLVLPDITDEGQHFRIDYHNVVFRKCILESSPVERVILEFLLECATCFFKPLPVLRPKYASFVTQFQTWSLKFGPTSQAEGKTEKPILSDVKQAGETYPILKSFWKVKTFRLLFGGTNLYS